MTAPTPSTASDSGDNQQPPASAPRKSRHVGRWLLACVFTLLLALTAATVWLAGTDSGTRNAWQIAVWAMQGKLSGKLVGGNLAEGVRLRDLRYRDATMQLDIDRIESSWRLSFRQRRLTVSYLHVGTVDINKQPTPPTPTV